MSVSRRGFLTGGVAAALLGALPWAGSTLRRARTHASPGDRVRRATRAKAEAALRDLPSGGTLNEEQARRFVDFVIDQRTLSDRVLVRWDRANERLRDLAFRPSLEGLPAIRVQVWTIESDDFLGFLRRGRWEALPFEDLRPEDVFRVEGEPTEYRCASVPERTWLRDGSRRWTWSLRSDRLA